MYSFVCLFIKFELSFIICGRKNIILQDYLHVVTEVTIKVEILQKKNICMKLNLI